MAPRILIVDDTASQLQTTSDIVRSYLGSDWLIVQASNLSQAREFLRGPDEFAIAVVDAYLTEPPLHQEGVEFLREVQERCGRRCFKILVSRKVKDRAELSKDAPIDEFVYLRRMDNVNPFDRLVDALSKAREHTLVTSPS